MCGPGSGLDQRSGPAGPIANGCHSPGSTLGAGSCGNARDWTGRSAEGLKRQGAMVLAAASTKTVRTTRPPTTLAMFIQVWRSSCSAVCVFMMSSSVRWWGADQRRPRRKSSCGTAMGNPPHCVLECSVEARGHGGLDLRQRDAAVSTGDRCRRVAWKCQGSPVWSQALSRICHRTTHEPSV